MRILKDYAIALLIDMQEKLFPHMQEKENLLAKTQILIKGLQVLEVPVIVTQQYTKGLGNTIPELANVLGSFEPFEKKSFSCFDEPSIYDALRKHGRSTIIIAGIETHVCILQTAIDLIVAGFSPVVAVDCTSSRNALDREIAFRRLTKEGVVLTTVESLLFELTRTSGTETFKKISALVK